MGKFLNQVLQKVTECIMKVHLLSIYQDKIVMDIITKCRSAALYFKFQLTPANYNNNTPLQQQ